MRNLSEYPMTYPEALNILDTLIIDLQSEMRIGDIRSYALEWLKEKLIEKDNNE